MASIKPFVLFVHSSFHEPAHFDPLRIFFHAAGYETACPQLPSSRNLSSMTFADDVDMIRDGLTQLIEIESLDVMVVAHGYGGVVVTEAADADLSKSRRTARGLMGGVVQLLYMCSYILPVGQSISSCFGNNLPSYVVVDERGLARVQDAESILFNDLCTSEQRHWADRLVPSSSAPYFTPITNAAYMVHPTTYLFTTEDAALPVEMQRKLVTDAMAANQDLTIRTIEFAAGHDPFLSMPERILELVQSITTARRAPANGSLPRPLM